MVTVVVIGHNDTTTMRSVDRASATRRGSQHDRSRPGRAGSRGPDAGLLAGRRIGFRVDVRWPAWDWTVAEWTERLERAGAAVTSWRRAQGLKGAEGERKQAEYDAFVGGVDVIVSGLGNCGSCTSWSVKDGLTGLARGLPSIVAVTEQFETLARTLAADQGRPGLRLLVLPFSLHTLPEDEVRGAARARFPGLLENLGARTA